MKFVGSSIDPSEKLKQFQNFQFAVEGPTNILNNVLSSTERTTGAYLAFKVETVCLIIEGPLADISLVFSTNFRLFGCFASVMAEV